MLEPAFPQHVSGGWDSNWPEVQIEGGDFEYKMVIVINSSLRMTAGKIAAQACHGAVGVYREIVEELGTQTFRNGLNKWGHEG